MFGIPTFDLTSDRGKQEFIEYIVNLTRKEINSYTPSYNISTASSPQGDLIGDVTSTGLATSIASNVIVNADVNTSAAIAYSKLNLTGAILNADLAGSIDPTKITGTAVITSDSRLTDARTPTAHAATHIPGGADVLDYSKIVGYGTALPTFSASLHPVGVLFAVNTIGEPYSLYRSDGSAFKQVGGGGASGIPVGTIIHTGQGTIPAGFLDCDGSSQLRSLYPALFAAIGTTFGAGASPGTTFALPLVTGTYGNFVILADAASVVITTQTLIGAPIATLQLFAGSVYPTGYLRADGTAISRTSYADLFGVIGTTYGVGDGSTTFNLPNLSASGAGSPVYIIKVSLSGTVEPSTIVHASSHIRAGTDVIDGDRVQVDYVPSAYTRNAAASGAGAVTDLTAHLAGIDAKFSGGVVASGGTVTNVYGSDGGYYQIHTFTANGSLIVTAAGYCDVLVVAGGGGGGYDVGGGGGAGGMIWQRGFSISATTYTVTVGTGGAVGGANATAPSGTNSVFSSLTAIGGGGGGGYQNANGASGGSGGGGVGYSVGFSDPGTGTRGQGNPGGPVFRSNASVTMSGSGGGGAGSPGGCSSYNNSAAGFTPGGAGRNCDITGSDVCYAVGGRAGWDGWAGASTKTANTGDGGDGAGTVASAGASGIVIVRYRVS